MAKPLLYVWLVCFAIMVFYHDNTMLRAWAIILWWLIPMIFVIGLANLMLNNEIKKWKKGDDE